jgi:hypothetical protein
MTGDCVRCGGACCETITLAVNGTNNDLMKFIELRSSPQAQPDGSTSRNFIVPCSMLKDGRCLIYDAGRPQMCKDFQPGGPHCQATVRARRSPEESAAILGEVAA